MRACAHSDSNPHARTEKGGKPWHAGRVARNTSLFGRKNSPHYTCKAQQTGQGAVSWGSQGGGLVGSTAAVAQRHSSSSAQAYSCVVAHKTSMVSASSLNCRRAGSDMALAQQTPLILLFAAVAVRVERAS